MIERCLPKPSVKHGQIALLETVLHPRASSDENRGLIQAVFEEACAGHVRTLLTGYGFMVARNGCFLNGLSRMHNRTARSAIELARTSLLANNAHTRTMKNPQMKLTEKLMVKEFMDAVRKHLSRHCVSLEIVRAGRPSPEQWEYATGILFDRDGQKLVLTAGHWVNSVAKAGNEGAVQEIHVRYSHVSDKLDARRLTEGDDLSDRLQQSVEFDGAFLHLPMEIAEEIARQGNHFFTRADCVLGTLKESHLALVCGYPCQATIISRRPAFYSMQEQKVYQHDMVSLESLGFQCSLLQPIDSELGRLEPGFNCDRDHFSFLPVLKKINSREDSGVTSAVGMSGGPLVAYPISEKNFMRPYLLGMQISQKSIDKAGGKEITELKSVSIRRLLDWMDAYVA